MIKKRFTLREPKVDNNIGCSEIADNGKWISYGEIVELLNRLSYENEQLKQILNELSNMLQFDVENGIRSYPIKLSEYLSNVLKELAE